MDLLLGLRALRHLEDICGFVDPAALLGGIGIGLTNGVRNPGAPSPIASLGPSVSPRSFREERSSSQESLLSLYPSRTATSSLVPSSRVPMIARKHYLLFSVSSSLTLKCIPSAPK
jgi:hypothetical protein